MSSKSSPFLMRKPKRSMRSSTTFGRPTKIGRAIFSSTTTCTARNTRSSSPSAKTTRVPYSLVFFFANANTGFMNVPLWYTNCCKDSVYCAMSSIGRVATPESIAACATAGAILTIKRGSNGFGIRYSGPKLKF